ncbi:unnamed protein product [Staurois parvus]|uniref:Uncharacterized protein n=1 Tax=Staurois parvus TaxID=386267 RepID=A0ABN9G0J2_9NEOB|nr:unnamed protein product [Staurois parvus]
MCMYAAPTVCAALYKIKVDITVTIRGGLTTHGAPRQ